MTRDELEKTAIKGIPVIFDDRARGSRIVGQITALTERYANGTVYHQAELKDVHTNSVCICDPCMLKVWDGSVEASNDEGEVI